MAGHRASTGEPLRQLALVSSSGETIRVADVVCWRNLEGRPCLTAGDRRLGAGTQVVIIPILRAAAAAVGPSTRSAVLEACARARDALAQAGVAVVLDGCAKETPGAKFHRWEHRGVSMRIEVGPREAAAGTYCLVLHAPAARGGVAAEADALPLDSVCSSSSSSSRPAPSAPSPAAATAPAPRGTGGGTGHQAQQPTQQQQQQQHTKLQGLTLEQLLEAVGGAACRSSSSAGAGAPGPGPVGCAGAAAAAGPLPLQQLQQLQLVQQPPSGSSSSSSIRGGPALCGKLHLWASAAREAAGPPQPCLAHLRHLAQLGRPCHCGRGHASLAGLQQEVERAYAAATGHSALQWLRPALPAPQPRRPPHAGRGSGGGTGSGSGAAAAGPGGDEGGRQADEGDGQEKEEEEEEGGAGTLTLLVGCIPAGSRCAKVQAALAQAFEPYDCRRVSMPQTRSGMHHGWARIVVGGPAEAARAVAALDGRLVVDGAPLSVSYSAGRVDTLFSGLPYSLRARLRVDAVGAFSVTDQATADLMTDAIAELAAALLLLPPPPPQVPTGQQQQQAPKAKQDAGQEQQQCGPSSSRPPAGSPSEVQAAHGPALGERRHQPAAAAAATARRPALLALAVTDATACSGGNTLSFLRRFALVRAVEMDEDRAADLLHNTQLIVAAHSAGAHDAAGAAAAAAGAAADASCSSSCFSLQERGSDGGGTSSRGTAASAAAAAMGGCVEEEAEEEGLSGRVAAAGGGSSWLAGPLGRAEVYCGDCTAVLPVLQQDIVFLDPPWGGPSYAARPGHRGADGVPVRAQASLMLGDTPITELAARLLSSGSARMCALKLPSRTDHAAFAASVLLLMQQQQQQMHMAQMPSQSPEPCCTKEEDAAGRVVGQAVGGLRSAVAPLDPSEAMAGGDNGRKSPGRQRAGGLLLVHVRLGRSALVVLHVLRVRGMADGSGGVAEAVAAAKTAVGRACAATHTQFSVSALSAA